MPHDRGALRTSGRRHDPLEEAIPDALGQAKRRWGEDGHVFLPNSGSPLRCLVGVAADHRMQVYGQRATWEQAFADADAKRNVALVRDLPPFQPP
jgi:hypothetical protein